MVANSRTLLFVPASRPDRYAKAAASGTDAVILDLEDAVADAEKNAARDALDLNFTDRPVLVRINGIGTPWHEEDVRRVAALRPAAVILPKAEEEDGVSALVKELAGVDVVPLIETAKGLARARQIAEVPGVVRLAFGSVDFCADLGCAHQRDVLLHARSMLVLASRLAGLTGPIDGVTLSLVDAAATYDDARHALDLGMGGKFCIHPRQIEDVRRAFAPTVDELDWARRVLSAADGAVLVDDAMVDEPVRIRARSLIARADDG